MRYPLAIASALTAALALPTALHAGNYGKASYAPSADKVAEKPTLVAIAAGNPAFSTLVAAVGQAGLAEALSGPGPFTIFAPTDAAFAQLPDGTLESLSVEQLQTILKHHVVAGYIPSEQAVAAVGTSVTTLAGTELAVAKDQQGRLTVGGAVVSQTDVVGSNGVIHIVETVILP